MPVFNRQPFLFTAIQVLRFPRALARQVDIAAMDPYGHNFLPCQDGEGLAREVCTSCGAWRNSLEAQSVCSGASSS